MSNISSSAAGPSAANGISSKDKNSWDRRYLREEKGWNEWDLEERANDALNFLMVPYYLEQTMSFGVIVVLDSFLFVFSALPVRLYLAFRSLLDFHRMRMHAVEKVDLIKLLLVVVGFLFIRLIPMYWLVDFIRSESLMKLKIMMTLLEVLDQVMNSYAESILGYLFWLVNQPPESLAHRRWGPTTVFAVASVYISVHSFLLLARIAVLDVAINSRDLKILSLLILLQFAELKSAVLKKFDSGKLLNMCGEDIVERFQLVVLLCLLFVHQLSKLDEACFWRYETAGYCMSGEWLRPLLFSLTLVYLSEILVDWLKHMSIVNFNRGILPEEYLGFAYDFGKKIAAPKASFLTDKSRVVSRGIGLVPLPLSVVVLRVIYDFLPSGRPTPLSLAFLAALWPAAVLARLATVMIVSHLLRNRFNRKTGFGRTKMYFRPSTKLKLTGTLSFGQEPGAAKEEKDD